MNPANTALGGRLQHGELSATSMVTFGHAVTQSDMQLLGLHQVTPRTMSVYPGMGQVASTPCTAWSAIATRTKQGPTSLTQCLPTNPLARESA